MTTQLFITATDTDAGKTLIACALTKKLVQANQKVAVFKPIAAGCDVIQDQLVNDDAKALQRCANVKQTLTNINPIAFLDPIAPHIAAQQEHRVISNELISWYYRSVKALNADFIVTEGAGGWRLPLGNGEFLSGFAQQHKLNIVLVVNMKLGCLNHAILTYQSIIADGLSLVGWVANCIDEMPYKDENIQLLCQTIHAPLLGVVGNVDSVEQAVVELNIDNLLKD